MVSMEMIPLGFRIDDEKNEHVDGFSFRGVTILGLQKRPACYNTEMKIIKFEDFENQKKITEQILGKDLGLLDQTLFYDTKNIKKEGDTVFNKTEFALGLEMSEEDFQAKAFALFADLKFGADENAKQKYEAVDYSDTHIYAFDNENFSFKAVPYSIEKESGVFSAQFEDIKAAKVDLSFGCAVEEADVDMFSKYCDLKMSACDIKMAEKDVETTQIIAEKDAEIEEEKAKFSTLETENNDAKAKYEILVPELTRLQVFEATVQSQEKEQGINFAMQEITAQKIFTEEQEINWIEKSKEFENVDSFKNALKVFAFDLPNKALAEQSDIHVIAIPKLTPKSKSGLWVRDN